LVEPHDVTMHNYTMSIERDLLDPPLPDIVASGNWALFLDLDGTLIDLAPTPDSVVVPKDLIETLAALHNHFSGALAIVSGRPLASLDALLQPLRLTVAGEHGAVLRRADGTMLEAAKQLNVPGDWRQLIRQAARNWPGTLVEEKVHSIAVHFRANPALEGEIAATLCSIATSNSAFEVLPAAMAREIRHRDSHKGAALRCLMGSAPFVARRPLFIGDDITDEDAIAAATDLGGIGLRVSDHFSGQPAEVRSWLKKIAGRE
jgi:trehalose 6-phosphate phosphatase